MVQNTHSKIRRNLIDKVLGIFHKRKIIKIPLDFSVSINEQGKQVINVSIILGDEKKKVKNIKDLWSNGILFEKNGVRYVSDRESFDTVTSFCSHNPRVTDDGSIVLEIDPSFLKDLRKRKNLHEDTISRGIKIYDEPLKHRAEITHDETEGLHVNAGYEIPGKDGVVYKSTFEKSLAPRYFKFGDSFYYILEEHDPNIKKWLDTKNKTIRLKDIYLFFTQDLGFLKSNFNAVLIGKSNEIVLLEKSKITEIPLDFSVSTNEQGKQVINVFRDCGDEKNRVKNLKDLWSYGFLIEKNGDLCVLDPESLDTLHSLRSMHPMITDDGSIISEIHPSFLKYLRKRKNVYEDATSKSIKIFDTPLKRRAEVTYDRTEGLHVKAGYEVPGQERTFLKNDFDKSLDDGYFKFGGSYYYIPDEHDKKIKKWIDIQEKTIDLNDIPLFFKQDLVLLKSDFNAVLIGKASEITVIERKFKPHVKIMIGEKGWLEFDIQYTVGQYVLPHELFKSSLLNYIRKDEKYIKIDYDTVNKTTKQLQALEARSFNGYYRVDITKFLSVEDFISHIGGIKEVSEEYQHFLDELTSFNYNQNFMLPLEVENDLSLNNIKLRPYQRSGIHWLNWIIQHHLHGILADDMGLGKTIQTIAAMRLEYESKKRKSHSLVVCPKSVIGHWQREIRRVFPKMDVHAFVGPRRGKYAFKRKEPFIFLTTYDILARDVDILEKVPFLFVVLDEGTKIKNPETKRTTAAKKLNAAHRLVLSGTPIENRPAELWSIFDFLITGLLGSYDTFDASFERPIQDGDNIAANKLAKKIRPFILRRLKMDVAKDLPEKIEMNSWCELTEEQRELYGQIQEQVQPLRSSLESGEYVSYTTILPIITKLKQVCDHPALITKKNDPLFKRSEKFDTIIELLDEFLQENENVVLFSHFLGTLDLFEIYLKDTETAYIRIDGSTRDRQNLIDKFNSGGISVALCSLMAGGHGINLTAANHVIHVDRWWNPAIEDQATDRVHRIGQLKTVYVHKILTKGTLEEKIDAIIERKRGISDKVIGAATKGVAGWTREELLEILEPIRD